MKQIAIKICGLKNIDEIQIVNDFPISYGGFIFAPSKRRVSVETVIQLSGHLRSDIQKVGVFVNESLEVINATINACGLQVVQLHGEESIETIQGIKGAQVWKTLSVGESHSISEQYNKYKQSIETGHIQGILLDTAHMGQTGGTGQVFDWTSIPDLVYNSSAQCILAGGLNAGNIEKAIEHTRCQIMDVNSGVEIEGIKNRLKLENLFQNIQKFI